MEHRQFHSCEYEEITWGQVDAIFVKKEEVRIKYSPIYGGTENRTRKRDQILVILNAPANE